MPTTRVTTDAQRPKTGVITGESISPVSLGYSGPRVYQVPLGNYTSAPAEEASLSESELARANAFRSTRVRSRYVRCRAALRQILGSVLGRAAADVDLRQTHAGRPFVPDADLDFNVSHSADLALIAVLRGGGSVGVDLERIGEIPHLTELAKVVCTSRELAQLFQQGKRRLEAFYRLWTCKEAYLKSVGSGISPDTARVEMGVSHLPRRRWPAPDGRCFTITTFYPRPGFVAALAVSGE